MYFYYLDINSYLRKILPQDAFCVCGFSWYDFFPSEESNHVLGEGSIENGTAAFTFGHYALFKKKELLRARTWIADYALEKPLDISDEIANEKSGVYDFVTEKEKEEAKIFTIECDQEGCAGSKLVNSPSKAGISKLNLSSLFNTTRSSINDIIQSHSSPGQSETASEQSETASASVESQTEQENYSPNGFQSFVMSSSYDESKDKALPPNTTFSLNCRVLRRLFRVCMNIFLNIFFGFSDFSPG